MGAALRFVGSRKYSEVKTASKASKKIQWRVRRGGERAEQRARLRWKESKSHWQEQTSSEHWIKVSGGWKRSLQLPLLFNEWRLLLCRKPGSWWASIYTFALGWLLRGASQRLHISIICTSKTLLRLLLPDGARGQPQHPCPGRAALAPGRREPQVPFCLLPLYPIYL